MKKIILILAVALMLLTVGCKPGTEIGNGLVNMPDVSRAEAEKILEEKIQQAEEMKDRFDQLDKAVAPSAAVLGEFKLTDKQSVTYGEKKVTLQSIAAGPLVDVDVDGINGRFVETKSEEVINGLLISVIEFKFKLKDSPENYVVLSMKQLELGEDEYLMSKDDTRQIGGMAVKMIEPRTDGSIVVSVSPSTTGNERIIAGSSKVIESLEISPVKVFTKDKTRKTYAIIKVVEQ